MFNSAFDAVVPIVCVTLAALAAMGAEAFRQRGERMPIGGLGLVGLLGAGVSASLLWSVICWLSRTNGLALSLSGIAGIIVSVGVTVDSYVVFFERLKDEVRTGRTLRNSAQRGFTAAWRTIVIADLVSLIGALVLWYLTVGAVRGFAFFLGLSTEIGRAHV